MARLVQSQRSAADGCDNMTPQLDSAIQEALLVIASLNSQTEPFIPYYRQEGELRIVVSHPPKDSET